MEQAYTIKRWGKVVLYRFALFILVYLALVALGAFLLYIAYRWATSWGPDMLVYTYEEVNNVLLGLFLFCSYIGVIALCVMFGLFLIKFIFAPKTDDSEKSIEIVAADCPQIFALIQNVAQATGCSMPYKVFLSDDVNAHAFYNNRFRSMFLPSKKNLQIGIGLFACGNTEEFKGVLAHEFGHFLQSSMKLSSALYYAHVTLFKLIYQEDAWDKWLNRWRHSYIWFFSFFGWLTYLFSYGARLLLQYFYRNVGLAYYEMSRQMEYDADRIANQLVGKDVMTSSLNKTTLLMETNTQVPTLMRKLAEERKTADPFEVLEALAVIFGEDIGATLSYQELLCGQLSVGNESNSLFTFEDPWSSHPSDKDRIGRMDDIPRQSNLPFTPSWALLPHNAKARLIEAINFQTSTEPIDLQPLKGDELMLWIRQKVAEETLKSRFSTFFSDADFINSFNPFEQELPAEVVYPFTETNQNTVAACIAGYNDLQQMVSILQGETDAKTITYRGKAYTAEDIPLEEHRRYMLAMRPDKQRVYAEIYAYLRSGIHGEEIEQLYRRLFKLNKLIEDLEEKVINATNEMIDQWDESDRNPADIAFSFECFTAIHQAMESIFRALSREETDSIEDKELVANLSDFAKGDLSKMGSPIKKQIAIRERLALISPFSEALYGLFYQIKKQIGQIAQAADDEL